MTGGNLRYPMAPYIPALRTRYDEARAAIDWLPELVREEVSEFATGDIAADLFGQNMNDLDALCLMAQWERAMPYVLWAQVMGAIHEQGRSWNEVAAALGVSRQAAIKRFGQRR